MILSWLVSVALGYFRISGYKSQAFQAIAHVWCGLLIGVGIFAGWCFWSQLIVLSILETICALVSRGVTLSMIIDTRNWWSR